MNFIKLKAFVFAGALLASAQANAETILRYATIGEPPSLDIQVGTATISSTISQHMFETLYAFDSTFTPQLHLAASDEVKDGGKHLSLTCVRASNFTTVQN